MNGQKIRISLRKNFDKAKPYKGAVKFINNFSKRKNFNFYHKS